MTIGISRIGIRDRIDTGLKHDVGSTVVGDSHKLESETGLIRD